MTSVWMPMSSNGFSDRWLISVTNPVLTSGCCGCGCGRLVLSSKGDLSNIGTSNGLVEWPTAMRREMAGVEENGLEEMATGRCGSAKGLLDDSAAEPERRLEAGSG
jgi:hypothetical protein